MMPEYRHLVQALDLNESVAAEFRVLKLHGSQGDWERVVLSGHSYAQFDERYRFLRGQLDTLLRQHTVVFAGCSMVDPRIFEWLATATTDWAASLKPWRPMMRRDAWEAAVAASQAQPNHPLSRGNIRPLLLERHEDLPAMWRAAADRLAPVPPGESSQPVSSPEVPTTRLWNVPALPDSYQPRSELERVRRALLAPSGNPLALTGQHTRFAVEGMGGVGKTVLAAAIARDPEVRRAFPGGIYWLTFGQSPEPPVILQARLASAVLGRPVTPTTSKEGEQLLRDAFSTRACLVILDDVWQGAHVAPFNVMGDLGRLLVTTRKHEVALGLGAESQRVDELSSSDAIALLAQYAGLPLDALPPEAPELVRECGELPLALAVVGSMLRGKPAESVADGARSAPPRRAPRAGPRTAAVQPPQPDGGSSGVRRRPHPGNEVQVRGPCGLPRGRRDTRGCVAHVLGTRRRRRAEGRRPRGCFRGSFAGAPRFVRASPAP